MFKSIVRPVRVSRFSKTVSFPQSNSSPTPGNRHGFNFDNPPNGRCLAQPPTSSKSRTTPVAIEKPEQTQRSPRTRDLIAGTRSRKINQESRNPVSDVLSRSCNFRTLAIQLLLGFAFVHRDNL